MEESEHCPVGAYDEEQGDGGKRLEQCKLWKQEKREYKGEDRE